MVKQKSIAFIGILCNAILLLQGGISGTAAQTLIHPTAVAWNATDTRIAAGFNDGSLAIFDQAQQLINTIHLDERISAVSWSSSDPHLLAVATNPPFESGKIYLLDTQTNQIATELEGGRATPSISWHPNTSQMVAATNMGDSFSSFSSAEIRIWDMTSFELAEIFGLYETTLALIAWSPDANYIASVDTRNGIMLWDVAIGEPFIQYNDEFALFSAIAWSPDSANLAIANQLNIEGPTLQVWNVSSNDFTPLLEDVGLTQVVWSQANWIASSQGNGVIQVWDTLTQTFIASYTSSVGSPIAWNQHGNQLVYFDANNQIQIANPTQSWPPDPDTITRFTLSPDGSRYATGHQDRTIRIWDAVSHEIGLIIPDDQEVSVIDADIYRISDLQFSPDNTLLAVSFPAGFDRGGNVLIFNVSTGDLVIEFGVNSAHILAWKPDGSQLAARTSLGLVGSTEAYITVWDMVTEERLVRLDIPSGSILGLAWSPDGERLAGLDGQRVVLWDTDTWTEILWFPMDEPGMAVVWHEDSDRLAAADEFGNVYVWNASSGQRELTLLSGNQENPSRERIAWDSEQGIVVSATDRLVGWDADSGEQLFIIDSPRVAGLGWLPNGDVIYASASLPMAQVVSPFAEGKPIADAGTDQTLTADGSGFATVTLDGSASFDPDGEIVSYVWTLDDVEIATGVNPQVTLSVGIHTITLTVTDDDGLTDSDEVTITILPISAPNRVTDNLVALYTFEEGGGSMVHDVSGVGSPLNLEIENPAHASWGAGTLTLTAETAAASPGAASKIIDAFSTSHEMTVEAWITPANLTQTGPARIVNLARDPSFLLDANFRNFTLSQGFNNGQPTVYEMRVRTTTTNGNGIPSLVTADGVVTLNRQHVVCA